jgi:hypothetical protein
LGEAVAIGCGRLKSVTWLKKNGHFQQAVLMALEVREAIGALTGKWRRFGHDIGFGIGIAHGFATLGTIG